MKTSSVPAAKLINPNLPTVSMPGMNAQIRFLSSFKGGILSVLRYGNRTQAETKRKSLAARLQQEESSSAVVQVESHFMIAIFPAEYDLDQKSGQLIAKPTRSRPPFATVSGPRFNPRNRHNQNGAGPVYCQEPPVFGVGWYSWMVRSMNRRDQYRAVSSRLNKV